MMLPQEILNIERLLSEFLGESKNGISENGQVQYPCPRCIDEKGPLEANKYNLEINLFRMVYQCWSCSTTEDTMKGPLSRLIKQYGNTSIYKRYKEEVESLKHSMEYDFTQYSGITLNEIEKMTVKLPSSFKPLDLETCTNKRAVEYCNKRAITQDIIDKFNIGYTDWTDEDYDWRNRIVVPSYDKYGELNYFVGRDFTEKKKNKYKNCDAKKNDIIFQESLINWDADIVLVEGTLDCLWYPNTISLLGKDLVKGSEIEKALHEHANGDIIIAIDGDTKDAETKKMYKSLNWNSLKGRIYYISMAEVTPYKDFADAYKFGGKKELKRIMKHCRQYSEFELNVM